MAPAQAFWLQHGWIEPEACATFAELTRSGKLRAIAFGAAPSPRLPSGRLRSSPSKTGVNALRLRRAMERVGARGPFPKLRLAERPPHPPPPFPPPHAGEGRVGATSPRLRGEVKAAAK